MKRSGVKRLMMQSGLYLRRAHPPVRSHCGHSVRFYFYEVSSIFYEVKSIAISRKSGKFPRVLITRRKDLPLPPPSGAAMQKSANTNEERRSKKTLDSTYSVVVKYNTKQPERTMNAGVLQER
jgi:hypothetical protein